MNKKQISSSRGSNSGSSDMHPSVGRLRKSKKTREFENVVDIINKGYRELVILRGLPGSGKSFLAKQILDSTIGYDVNHKLHIFSSDDYFHRNKSGTYMYDAHRLDNAHKWNQRRAIDAISRGFSPVIIDNTNTQLWEMIPYVRVASDFGYQIAILEPDTPWCFNEKELTKRNIHGVPKAKIRNMIGRYEKNITTQILLSACKLTPNQPMFRLYPPPHIQVPNSMKANSETGINNFENLNLKQPPDSSTVLAEKKVAEENGIPTHINSELPHMSVNVYDEIMELSSDDDYSQKKAPKDSSDVETLWGINHDTLKTWDIVRPIEDCASNPATTEVLTVINDVVDKKDACVMTEDDYFLFLQGSEVIFNDNQLVSMKVLTTFNRNINIAAPNRKSHTSKIPTLDKSCMTDDLNENYENHLSQLANLFPAVPKSHLSYWYNKSKGDMEWAIEFLLEAKEESSIYIDFLEQKETISQPVSNDSKQSEVKVETPTTERSEKVKKSFVEDSDLRDLKRLIENKIDIGEDHYSKHLLRIKKSKYSDKPATGSSKVSFDTNLPSTSGHQDKRSTVNEDIISVDSSDMDTDELDSDDSENKCNHSEEIIEINLGDHLVTQLENQFGNLDLQYPKGLQPVVQVPKSLARQLYTFYIESAYQQMENQMQIMNTLVQEDEEFAKKLQAQEKEASQSTRTHVPNLKEIMADQQVAQSLSRKEADDWKKLNPDDLAAKLTRQKLFRIFPKVPQDTLVEILHAHENKYKDTIETLIASMDNADDIKGDLLTIKEPPINDAVLEEMKEAQRSDHIEEYEGSCAAIFYREEANKYLKKRSDYYQKAQQYHRRGMKEVAQFYSGLASSQTVHFDRANNLAATTFLDEHSKRLQDFNTLDLHFLYVKEAITSLDVFLDRNINLLRLSDKKHSEYLQIITGRGKRSAGGISKIKPAVQSRLKKRRIKFVTLNPGLLEVKVNRTSRVTSEIPV